MRALKIEVSLTKKSTVLDKYLNELSKIELLTAEQEISLCSRIQDGDQAALNKLVQSNLRFVVSVAKKYQCPGFPLEDLICEGNMGLIRAAQRFDATRGFKFISFAVWWVRQAIIHAIAEKRRIIRLPANQVNAIIKLTKESSVMEQLLERAPSMEELADFTDLSIGKVMDCMGMAPWTLSLDQQHEAEHGVTLLDCVPDQEVESTDGLALRDSLGVALEELMKKLSPREKKILKWSYGIGVPLPMQLEEIARELKLSKERVRQIKASCMKLLRKKVIPGRFDY
nr:RNA polymerase sigma factor RpoD/SigA [Pedobacter panaciterrae]